MSLQELCSYPAKGHPNCYHSEVVVPSVLALADLEMDL